MAFSMSYCIIENAHGVMGEALSKFMNKQNDLQTEDYEKAHLEGLYKVCKKFVEEYEEYLEDKDMYVVEHSEEEDDDE